MNKKIIYKMLIIMLFFSCTKESIKKIEASGIIEIRETEIPARNNETIKKIFAKEGDAVKENEIIAEVNHDLLDLQLIQVLSNYTIAEKDFKRAIDLYTSNNISLKEKELTENKYITAKTTYEILKKQIDDCYIKSPLTGIITNRFIEKGEYVTIGTPIYTVTQIDPITITIYITEKELIFVKIGAEAKVKIDGTNKMFIGKVIYISPKAEFTPKNIQTKEERVKQLFAVKIEVVNKEGLLKPGMYADVILENL